VLSDGSGVVEHGTSRSGRWLRARRTRIALIIAAVEAILVAVFHNISQWTVIGIAVVAVALYMFAGRDSRSDAFRQSTWIFAISQLLAVLAALFAFIVFWSAIVLVVVFAVLALFVIVTDRR